MKEATLTDEQLMSLVRDFSASYSGKDEVAWNELKTIPRTELINRVVQLREKATSEIDRVAIAFLLCNLDFEYKTNKEMIIAAFNKEPHGKNSGSSWEV